MKAKPIIPDNINGVEFFKQGKVRDIYRFENKLLIVSSDRISCFDVILPTLIPGKGEVLTKVSQFWFNFTEDLIENHMISTDIKDMPPALKPYEKLLKGRTMMVKKTEPLPVECVVRGYLSGSGWKEYKQNRSICGINLPTGLKESDKLPEVIFTPSTKEDVGHDQNVSQKYVEDKLGKEMAGRLKKISIALYEKARDYALKRGIIIADTKFEFGVKEGKLILIDEILTPDSSRFWPKDEYCPGKGQPSFDKQFVRDYLETLDWDKTPPGPELPDEIVKKTQQKYAQALELLTSKELGL